MNAAADIVHGVLLALQLWLMLALKQHGVKFDLRIWRNGKDEKANG